MKYVTVTVHEPIVVHKEANELRTTKPYYEALIDITTNLDKSGAMLYGLVKAELEKKYKGLTVEFELILKTSPTKGWIGYRNVPRLVLKFYDGNTYNKFKLVEGLIGKE